MKMHFGDKMRYQDGLLMHGHGERSGGVVGKQSRMIFRSLA